MRQFVQERGYKEVHVQQLYRSLFRASTDCFFQSADGTSGDVDQPFASWEAVFALCQSKLPTALVQALPEAFSLGSLHLDEVHESKDDHTVKFVVALHDGHRVETVLMRHDARTTVCVSSQIGCQMGCKFCATGTMGIVGNLCSAEILEQVAHAGKFEMLRGREAPSNVVFMGMGEPLMNYDAVKDAILGLTDESRFKLQKSHVTVSTVGVTARVRQLTAEIPEVALALSLHAPDQKLREQIVPAAKAHPLPKLMAAIDEYLARKKVSKKSSKHLMIEYVLLAGVNDLDEHAHALGTLLEGKPVYVNLIPYNPNLTAALEGYSAPTPEAARRFGGLVMEHGLKVRLRIEMGQDIAAACGQLALASPAGAATKGGSQEAKDIEELGAAATKSAERGWGGRQSAPRRRKCRKPLDEHRSSASLTADESPSRLAATLRSIGVWLVAGAVVLFTWFKLFELAINEDS